MQRTASLKLFLKPDLRDNQYPVVGPGDRCWASWAGTCRTQVGDEEALIAPFDEAERALTAVSSAPRKQPRDMIRCEQFRYLF